MKVGVGDVRNRGLFSAVGEISAASGVGGVTLRTPGRTEGTGFIGHTLSGHGPGKARSTPTPASATSRSACAIDSSSPPTQTPHRRWRPTPISSRRRCAGMAACAPAAGGAKQSRDTSRSPRHPAPRTPSPPARSPEAVPPLGGACMTHPSARHSPPGHLDTSSGPRTIGPAERRKSYPDPGRRGASDGQDPVTMTPIGTAHTPFHDRAGSRAAAARRTRPRASSRSGPSSRPAWTTSTGFSHLYVVSVRPRGR